MLKTKIIHFKCDIIFYLYRFLCKIGLPMCQGIDGPCLHFGKRRRQNTAYQNDSMNYVFMCNGCAKINNKLWDEQYKEHSF